MQINNTSVLASNVASTGAAFNWQGGKGMFLATATWGGGTVKLEFLLPDATTWVTVSSPAGNAASLTADGMKYFELPAGKIRANIATSTAVYAYVAGIHQ